MMMDDTQCIYEVLKFFHKIREQSLLSVDLIEEMDLVEGALLERVTRPDKKWVSLSSDEIVKAWRWGGKDPYIEGAHFVVLYEYFEDKLKEKNYDQYFYEKYAAPTDGDDNVRVRV